MIHCRSDRLCFLAIKLIAIWQEKKKKDRKSEMASLRKIKRISNKFGYFERCTENKDVSCFLGRVFHWPQTIVLLYRKAVCCVHGGSVIK